MAGCLRCMSGKPVEKRQYGVCVVHFVCHGDKYGVECPKKVNPYVFGADCVRDHYQPKGTVKDSEVYPLYITARLKV